MKSGSIVVPKYLLENFFNLIFFVIAYYFLKRVQIPRLLDRGKPVLFTLSLVVSAVVITAGWYGVCPVN